MRLVAFIYQSKLKLGAVLDNYILDLESAVDYIDGWENDQLHPEHFLNFKALLGSNEEAWTFIIKTYDSIFQEFIIDPTSLINTNLILPSKDVQLQAPLLEPGKVICIAGNFPTPENKCKPAYPTVFMKPSSTITGPGRPVLLSNITQNVAIEVELGIVIGKMTRHVQSEKALEYVLGYLVANDIGDRVIEKRTSQWTSGKMFDSFTPIGPWLVTKDEILSPNNLEMTSHLNGSLVQKGNTSEMFFSCEEIISYLSDLTTLYPGDLILMGSPKFIDNNPNPEVSLKDGDIISIRIDGLGELINPVQKE